MEKLHIVGGKKTLVDTPNPMKFQAYAKYKLGMDGLVSQRVLLKLGNSPRKWWYGIKYIFLFIVAFVDVNNYNIWIDLRESRLKYINYYASNIMLNENNIHVEKILNFFGINWMNMSCLFLMVLRLAYITIDSNMVMNQNTLYYNIYIYMFFENILQMWCIILPIQWTIWTN